MGTDKTDPPSKSGSKIRYKVVFLGDQNAGKSSIVRRYINNSFTSDYEVRRHQIRRLSELTS